jgi:hypothetical protein
MEDIIKECNPKMPSKKQKQEWDFKRIVREKYISLARSLVVKKQITEAYEILDRIDFKYVSDTAFRDCVTIAMKNLENALNDFLLNEQYHRERIKEFNKMTPKEYFDNQNKAITEMEKIK